MTYTVQQLARLSGISVRTLHYYDEVGLLKPGRVQRNGYREYGEAELLALQQILFFKELDFTLEDIKRMMQSPGFDVREALRDQKRLLRIKRHRLDGLIKSIDKTIKNMNDNKEIDNEELYDAFKDDDVKQYQDEVKQRWGNSDAYKQSMARVSKMTKKEMAQLKEDGKKHTQAIADAMDKGISHPDVQALISKSHEGVNFFYDCDVEFFRNLGKMYVADPRFTAYYEKFRPGLAVFVRDAIEYYCDQQEKKQ
jgi:DNA-binding transcriptional MerR regulator